MADLFEKRLVKLVEADHWMLHILKIVRDLELNDCWIGAGFLRNKIWNVAHNFKHSVPNDIDVIYYNALNTTKAQDLLIEEQLKGTNAHVKWSVKNQARMHARNGHAPYQNCKEAISFWPETATAVAIKLNTNNSLEYIAPYGLEDLFHLIVKPTPNVNIAVYNKRIQDKNWLAQWPKLNIEAV